jgi:AraC-like DNA-binding protein
LNAQLDELHTQYEVEKITAEKERIRNYLLFTLGGCLLLVIILGIYIYYNRMIQIKNRGIFRKIKEQDALVESLEQIAKKYDALTTSGSKTGENDIAGELNREFSGDRQQRKLVAGFNEYLTNEQRFANSEINIDEIISVLATNRSYFYDAVKTVTNKTPGEFINDLRLEEAKRMLENNFVINVELISEKCGFNNRMTF